MRWTCLVLLVLLAVKCTAKEEGDSNEVSLAPPSINLNVNLRKALLKALIELENEDKAEEKNRRDEDSNRIVEKASASALSVFTSSEDASTSSTSVKPTTEKAENITETSVLFQKSQAVQHSPITTVEKEELDAYNDAEQILTSASSSFTLPNRNSFPTDREDDSKSFSKDTSNTIKYNKATTPETNQIEVTTSTPPSSTEESEAKAEEVQFFSAPLVAAFTVHQDEQGVPKKVESIFKPSLKKPEEHVPLKQSKPDPHLEFQRKQKLLEQEITRLNLNLKQQQLLNQQQQEQFLRQQQEQQRLRSNAQPFLPISNPTFKEFNSDITTQKPVVNQFIQLGPTLPIKPAQPGVTNNSGVTLLSSITYDPIVEAGKLPPNAQVLPIKGAINFHTPIIQTAGFQQFHSLPQITPFVGTLNHLPINPQFILSDQVGKRTFRQEVGTGNFLNSNVNPGSQSFSIQKSVQPINPQQILPNFLQNFNAFTQTQPFQNNRFFTSNLEGTLTAPPQIHNNRVFRSNQESNFRAPSNFVNPRSNSYQLNNLLYNSGALGGKAPEDLNLITKVLALNHSGGQYANSNGFGR